MARWTFSFLLIHNVVTMTNFAFSIIIRLDFEAGIVVFESSVFKAIEITHNILNEIELILVVLSVPMSYLVGIWAQCCCGFARGNDMEMDKGHAHDMFSRIFRMRIYEIFSAKYHVCDIKKQNHELTNLKCCKKAREPFKPPFFVYKFLFLTLKNILFYRL